VSDLRSSTHDELGESDSPVCVDESAGLLVVHVVSRVAHIPARVCSVRNRLPDRHGAQSRASAHFKWPRIPTNIDCNGWRTQTCRRAGGYRNACGSASYTCRCPILVITTPSSNSRSPSREICMPEMAATHWSGDIRCVTHQPTMRSNSFKGLAAPSAGAPPLMCSS
jgi:hypothetical protein